MTRDARGPVSDRDLLWAIGDIFSEAKVVIAAMAAFIGYILVEVLRKKL